MMPGHADVVEIYTLWNRLKKRFSLVRPQPHSFKLLDTVQPITNVDSVLNITLLKLGTAAVTANGNLSLLTVPVGKRWEVSVTYVSKSAGGTFDFENALIFKDGDGIAYHFITPGSVIDYYHPHPLILSAGDELGVNITNFAGAGDAIWRYWVNEITLEE